MIMIGVLLAAAASLYFLSVVFLFTGLFKLRRETSDIEHTFSVIIAVHNEERSLEACLDCCINQNYSSEKYEIIIADDRSTDSTPDIVERYCKKFTNVKYVRVEQDEPAVPKKTALAKALRIAVGEIILSTDGDCLQGQGWIAAMNRNFTERVGMVIGHVGYFKPGNVWEGIDALDYCSHRALGAAFIGVNSVYTCTAANMAYRKVVYDANVEGFAQLKVRPAEDNYLLHCTRNSGYAIAVATDPGSIVETAGARDFSHFMQQRFRWAAYGGNITTTGVKLFFIPALFFYVMLWTGFAATIFSPLIAPFLLLAIAGKSVVEFMLIARYVSIYRIGYMLRYFIPLSIVHPVFAPLVAIWGNLFSFTWKNRRYTSEREIGEGGQS
ncbi:MAG: glycosyltransferase [Chitinispirillaceae bacterium]|nr:glycosyltransferase [Chitinispirillaceae bacterium]